MGNFAISLYNPNKPKEKRPFGIVLKAQHKEDASKFLDPNEKTFISEAAENYAQRLLGDKRIYIKSFSAYLEREPGEKIAQCDVDFYNTPLLVRDGIRMSALIDDTGTDPLRNMLIMSVMDADGFPSEMINQAPFIFFRQIYVIENERRKGYGEYLLKNTGELLRATYGLNYNVEIVSNIALADQKTIDSTNTQKWYDNLQGIIRKMFDANGFAMYYEETANNMKFFRKTC